MSGGEKELREEKLVGPPGGGCPIRSWFDRVSFPKKFVSQREPMLRQKMAKAYAAYEANFGISGRRSIKSLSVIPWFTKNTTREKSNEFIVRQNLNA